MLVNKLMLLAFAVFSGYVFVNAGTAPASPAEPRSDKLWEPILAQLLVEPQGPKGARPYSQPIDQDLQQLNADEMTKITAQWNAKLPKLGLRGKDAIRNARNRFFREKVAALNAITFKALTRAMQERGKRKYDYRATAMRVLQKLQANPVARVANVENFQEGQQIGFCFGRALLIHYLLLQEGVPQGDIAKVFLLGDLIVDKVLWKFHVAALVPDSGFGYLVIDPLQKGPMGYEEWFHVNAAYEVKAPLSRARFYVTDPRKFLPSFGAYAMKELENPILRPYFQQLAMTLTPAQSGG